jgi:hypothetical protein
MESYQQTVNVRFALLKDMHTNCSSTSKELSDSLEVISNELVSSVSRFHNHIIFGDTGWSISCLIFGFSFGVIKSYTSWSWFFLLCLKMVKGFWSTTWIPRTPWILISLIVRSLVCHIGLFAISREYQPGELLILYHAWKLILLIKVMIEACSLTFPYHHLEFAGVIQLNNLKSMSVK